MNYEERRELMFQEEIKAERLAAKNWNRIECDYDPNIGGKTGLIFGGNAEDFEECSVDDFVECGDKDFEQVFIAS